MKVSVNVNNYELMHSSVVHIEGHQDVELDIDGLKLKFIFIEDDSEKSSGYKGVLEGDVFVMRLRNFNNSLGEGVFKPIELGNLDNRKLYLTFYVNTFKRKDRRFEYNFFLGAKE